MQSPPPSPDSLRSLNTVLVHALLTMLTVAPSRPPSLSSLPSTCPFPCTLPQGALHVTEDVPTDTRLQVIFPIVTWNEGRGPKNSPQSRPAAGSASICRHWFLKMQPDTCIAKAIDDFQAHPCICPVSVAIYYKTIIKMLPSLPQRVISPRISPECQRHI